MKFKRGIVCFLLVLLGALFLSGCTISGILSGIGISSTPSQIMMRTAFNEDAGVLSCGYFFIRPNPTNNSADSEKYLEFVWCPNSYQFTTTSLPISKFRWLKSDDKKDKPTIKFEFDQDFGYLEEKCDPIKSRNPNKYLSSKYFDFAIVKMSEEDYKIIKPLLEKYQK